MIRFPATLRRWLSQFTRPQTLGQRGEAAAARHLKRQGYKILARGQRVGHGELDLIAVDGRTVVFVEVKTRQSHEAGHPFEAVDPDKQRLLTRHALRYLKRHGLLEYSARFDVIGITWRTESKPPLIEHIKNAFEPVGRGQMFG